MSVGGGRIRVNDGAVVIVLPVCSYCKLVCPKCTCGRPMMGRQ